MAYFNSFYLDQVFEDPAKYKELVKRAAANVVELQEKYNFDAIAFTGASGAALAYPISVLTGIPILYVRKDNENSHGTPIEGSTAINIEKYAIIDDLVSTGTTINGIIKKLNTRNMKCVCVMLYFRALSCSDISMIECPVYDVNKEPCEKMS